MENTIKISAKLVHLRRNAKTGKRFYSVSIPPKDGRGWGSFTTDAKNVRNAPFEKGMKLIRLDPEKTYVTFGLGDAKKGFAYKPDTLVARMGRAVR